MDPKVSAAAEVTAECNSAAAEHTEEPQLAELLTQETGLSTQIELKVIRSEIMDYTYMWQGKEVPTQKLQIILQSKIAEQYCLGVAKLQKKDKTELKQMADRWQIGTTWRLKDLTLHTEKPAYIHTPCRIAIDLRKTKTEKLLQSASYPPTPVPTITIADVLELKQMQRFDLMAIPAAIIEERKSGAGVRIADVRLVDGRKQDDSNTTEYASLPLTLFFKDEKELTEFRGCVGKKPLLFMCLAGSCKDGKVNVSTVRNQSWWQVATGSKAAAMAEEAPSMCGADAALKDVAALQAFTASEKVDYISPMATLTACRVVDPTCAAPASLLGAATEHLYQLNHVYVIPPTKATSIKTKKDDRLFARLDVWDNTKKISLAFRSKAMLQLAFLEEGQDAEYEQRLEADELRHPLLASLRLRVRSTPQNPDMEADATEPSQTQADNVLSAVVVEAAPCTFTDIPNSSLEAIHGLLAGVEETAERLALVPLDKLKPSPFYNMLADGKPVEKALALLHFTQRGNGKLHAHGYRIVTERTHDATAGAATELAKSNCYATVALCTVEKSPDFLPAKDSTQMAVISKVVAPSKPQQHAADLYIESMELVPKDDIPNCVDMMHQMYRIANAQSGDPAASSEVAWQQRKCRRLLRYPTVEENL